MSPPVICNDREPCPIGNAFFLCWLVSLHLQALSNPSSSVFSSSLVGDALSSDGLVCSCCIGGTEKGRLSPQECPPPSPSYEYYPHPWMTERDEVVLLVIKLEFGRVVAFVAVED